MSDDSDLFIVAAATAAVITWAGTRHRQRAGRAARRPDWRALLRTTRAGLARTWRETPGYVFVRGILDAFFRKR